MVAYVAGQSDLVHSFSVGNDVYSEFASEVYGRKCTKADKVERHVGKTCILGLGYGMGHVKFRDTLATSFIKVDVDEHRALARDMGVSSIPDARILDADGAELERFVGEKPADEVASILRRNRRD